MAKSKRNAAILESAIKGNLIDLKKLVEQALAEKVSKEIAKERKIVAESFLKGK